MAADFADARSFQARLILIDISVGGSLEHNAVFFNSKKDRCQIRFCVAAKEPCCGAKKLLLYFSQSHGSFSINKSYINNSSCDGFHLEFIGSSIRDRTTLHLFRSPVASSFTRTLAKGPLIELFGVQHMKMYVVDDTVFITGYAFVS